ncbi:MAG: hypothetical protein HKO53_02160, partial [Gemmatimonadetes bacterium]|nr:hypothetical protein [Gemmatimonadota bacterium]
DRVLLIGEFAEAAGAAPADSRVAVFNDIDALATALTEELHAGDLALFKASRGMSLESAYATWSAGAGPAGKGEDG